MKFNLFFPLTISQLLLAEFPEYGGFPKTTIIGKSRFTLEAAFASSLNIRKPHSASAILSGASSKVFVK